MNTIYTIITLCLLFLSCSREEKTIDLKNINGYWEIDHVITNDGAEKKYGFNPFIDFFETTTDSIGFRSKVKPKLGGKYRGNKQKINYRITTKNDSVFITYENVEKKWSDILIEASPNQICLQNNLGNLYFYRPYTPIIINEKN